MPIVRAKEEGDFYFLEGIASSTSIDLHETIFSLECQKNFEEQILNSRMLIESGEVSEDDIIKAESEHDGRLNPIFDLGVVDNARLNDNMLWVQLKLDKENPLSTYYFKIINNPDPKRGRPKKLGLSINGFVKKWRNEFSKELNKNIVVFDEFKLKRIGIVRFPSNPDTSELYAIARSIRVQCIDGVCRVLDPDTFKDVTNFPESGDTRDISFENSKFSLFPLDYAEGLRENWPSIWKMGGNVKGNKLFELLKNSKDKQSEDLSSDEKNAIVTREKWAKKHESDSTIAGVIAQIKYMVVNSRGIDYMKSVINKEKTTIAKKLVKKSKKNLK